MTSGRQPIAAHFRSIGSAIVVALAFAGCGSAATTAGPTTTAAPASMTPVATASPSPTPTIEPQTSDFLETGRIEVRDGGYAITLADNWFRIDLSDAGIQQILDVGVEQLPEGFVAKLPSQVRQMIASGVSLLAYREADSDAPIGTNLNVITLPAFGLTLDTLETLNVGQLKQLLGADTVIESRRVDLPAGEAIELRYEISLRDTNGSAGVTQYFLLGETRQLVLTCTVPDGSTAIQSECFSAAKSVEFLQ